MAIVRGDRELNETKLARHLGAQRVRMASDREVEAATAARVGFAGPVGFAGTIVVDPEAAGVENAVTGANETDHHLVGVRFGLDYRGELVDLRVVAAGEPCPRCDDGALVAHRGIEGGHIFVLGTHYTARMNALYRDADGEAHPLVMGCYGIGITRLIAATVEQHHDARGIVWPTAIAPFRVIVTIVGDEREVQEAGERIYAALSERGVEALLDDRHERPGIKFNDAELLGIPVRVTVGRRGVERDELELTVRRSGERLTVGQVGLADRIGQLVEAL
jgi:prolyl-tRNA synthetase